MQNPSKRYCADPSAIAAMQRDGIGWGHDLECGCFEAPLARRRPSLSQRIANWMKGV